jgi:adenine-specific DNA-methyltransferase
MDGMGQTWKILLGDCLDRFAEVETGSVALVLTSPPYNIGKPYEEKLELDSYLLWCGRWLAEISRVLTPTGAAWINLGFVEVGARGKAVPLAYLLWPLLIDLYLVQEVVWRYENGVACRRRLSPRNEKLLWLVRDPSSYRFDLDAIRDPNIRYPNSRKQGRLRYNPLGKNPGDVWHIPKVTAGRATAERTPHPAQMPLALAERIVLACSQEDDLVLDPFAGSGTSLAAARHHGRRALGIERDPSYVAIAERRLSQLDSRWA